MLTVSGQREKILTAYMNLLVDSGVRGTTLEAVGTTCKLSKAGVLHHFSSKQALGDALLEELRGQARVDADNMLADLDNAVSYYIVSSQDRDSLLERLVEAVYRLAQTGDKDALDVLRQCREGWFDALVRAIGDASVARLVLFVGDGMNHNALLSVDSENEKFINAESTAEIMDAIAQLRA
ncbi:TetR family transcriptional regulator [Pseudoclavibacter sp. RFBJ3]|uniref:TetR/AcrR family transcriptional regulator n=1 Tax=unclassified Pseudoclavibacter TaxID=2615177 RepID=UPI000CE8FD9C|nr:MULTISPECIES: TetR family transcriptional regulator [unclassified Pseudoclavibacter]PPF81450.1 TetR family transcriptional regulator [Pseudoclavibacter sp. RFBJ5]PPF90781.1 TetR family transcriptional regulator [Pseudoclavibacter sp. RFBJ3]PPG00588.1 TetR family transcriptional regulator [Pseudoclavibacter sp. RFBH5]PPG21077.1 TetR family transcriptional regulator [Pseudoclavibacter sp. RFBI4]